MFKLSHPLTSEIFKLTNTFPVGEKFGLISQMRRAAVSVPSNIVEGCTRESQAEYLRFLEMAFGSLRELHYQFDLAKRLGYLNEDDIDICESKILETEKVLGALIRSLRKN